MVESIDNHSPPSYSELTELLTFLNTHHIHQPKLVTLFGRQLILHHRSKLGDKGQ